MNDYTIMGTSLQVCAECLVVYDTADGLVGCPACSQADSDTCPTCRTKNVPGTQFCEDCPPDTGCPDIDFADNQFKDKPSKERPAGPTGYFASTRGTGKPSGAAVSRDDQNRRLRERRMGFAAPSDDWENSGIPIIGIYDGQNVTTFGIVKLRELGSKQCCQYWTKTTCCI